MYFRKSPPKAADQAGVPALSLEAGITLEGICFPNTHIMRVFVQCFYLCFFFFFNRKDPDFPLFNSDSSEAFPASEELLTWMGGRAGSGLFRFLEESWNRDGKATRRAAELFHLTPESQSGATPWKFIPFLGSANIQSFPGLEQQL